MKTHVSLENSNLSNRDVAYRDFIYLDIDRLQSILAQLEQGLLTDLIAGRSKEVGGTANIAAGLLSQFLPLTVSAGGKISSDVRESKVLHDYAFTVALNRSETEACFWKRRSSSGMNSRFLRMRSF